MKKILLGVVIILFCYGVYDVFSGGFGSRFVTNSITAIRTGNINLLTGTPLGLKSDDNPKNVDIANTVHVTAVNTIRFNSLVVYAEMTKRIYYSGDGTSRRELKPVNIQYEPVTEKGFCWNTTGEPTVDDSCCKVEILPEDEFGAAGYYCKITGLKPCTKYFIRAYTRDKNGIYYRGEILENNIGMKGGTQISDVFVTTPPRPGNLDLWLNPENIPLSQASVSNWKDATPNNNDAVQANPFLMPGLETNLYLGFPAVRFDNKNTGDEVLNIPNDPNSINSISPKGLFIVFAASGNAGFRHVLFEAGGQQSGYNIYLQDGQLFFQKWNGSKKNICNIPLPINFSRNVVSGNTYSFDKIFFAYIEFTNSNIKVFLNNTRDLSPHIYTQESFGPLGTDESANIIGGDNEQTNFRPEYSGNQKASYNLTMNVRIFEIMISSEPSKWDNIEDYFAQKYKLISPLGRYYKESADEEPEIQTNNSNSSNGSQFDMTQPAPNPFHDVATFRLKVEEQQNVRIELYDATGRMVSSIFNDQMNQGYEQDFTIDGTQLPAGNYFLKVMGSNFIETKKLVLVR